MGAPQKTEGAMTNVSDIRTRIESGVDEQSFLATKGDEPEKTPVLTLVDTGGRNDACDPLIQALVGKLPKPNTVWPNGDRAKWLKAAAMDSGAGGVAGLTTVRSDATQP